MPLTNRVRTRSRLPVIRDRIFRRRAGPEEDLQCAYSNACAGCYRCSCSCLCLPRPASWTHRCSSLSTSRRLLFPFTNSRHAPKRDGCGSPATGHGSRTPATTGFPENGCLHLTRERCGPLRGGVGTAAAMSFIKDIGEMRLAITAASTMATAIWASALSAASGAADALPTTQQSCAWIGTSFTTHT